MTLLNSMQEYLRVPFCIPLEDFLVFNSCLLGDSVHAHRATLIKLQEFSQLTECLNTPRELGTVSEMPFHMLVLVKRSCSCIS